MGIALTLFLALALVVMMFSLGLGLVVDDFVRVAREPRAFAIGLLSQFILIPAVAFALCLLFALPPAIAVGLMILSLCPGGPTSNLMTRFAGGDLALSISLTGVSNLAAVVTMPFLVVFFAGHFMGLDAPDVQVTALGLSMFAVTAVPVAAGMLVRRQAPATATAMDAPVYRVSIVLLIVVIAGALVANWDLLVENLPSLGPSVILLNAVLLVGGLVIARLFGLDRPQATSIAIDTGIQNAALGIAIGALIADRTTGFSAYSIPSGVYGVTMYFVSIPFVLWRKRAAG